VTRAELASARRVVVKLGTSLLTPSAGELNARRFSEIAAEVAALMRAGREVLIVSSGAVGLGVLRLGDRERPRSIPEKQAAAAIGQIDLCRRFERAFARHDLHVGQVLLTHTGLADRERFLNARHTLQALLGRGVVPLINENDSVATEELRFGDNDALAALVVNLSGADLLVMLTDVDGLHDRSPREPGAQRISQLAEISAREFARVGPGSQPAGLSTGGMRSKLEAARSAARYGAAIVIADGRSRGALGRIFAGEDVGTLVAPANEQLSSRKHWIAYSLKPKGALRLDSGAVRALLERGRSLLPIGISGVEGRFRVGDPVRCLSEAGDEVARGLICYDAEEVDVIKGHRSPRISELLGYSNGDEVIHRDDLVLL
jgi:glutamate 5-kinase